MVRRELTEGVRFKQSPTRSFLRHSTERRTAYFVWATGARLAVSYAGLSPCVVP